ncbi:MAG: glycosyltransferase family 39 protein [Candidatus Daviesbacteria bacterium]|nr:glycosyltransferase family 39 protein [Candidatus Daviesbacteria bacterium]
MRYKIYTALFLIVTLSFFLRFCKVTEDPPALNWDEVSIGYNAYSILKTGKDEWNQPFPIHFKAYGEYKLPVQIYASIPGIYIFGLNELGVRITPVVYGTLTVLCMFFLGRVLFENELAGLASAFLLGISPWHIHLTRASFESSLATFFVTAGIWFLVKGFKDQKWFIISVIPFALSVFTYNSARIFTPLFLIAILFLYRKSLIKFRKVAIISVVFFTILLLPLIPYLFSGERSARYKLVSITDDPGLIPRINENRGNSKLPQPLPRFVHNKVTYIAFYFTRNYLSHFTPQFLFISGAPHKQHHVQNMGELYYFQAPFLFLGLYALFRLKNPFKGFLFAWILLAFIPVATTGDSIPHALRTLIAAPFYQLVSGLGFVFSLRWFKKFSKVWKIISIAVFVTVIITGLGYYLYQYYKVYPVAYSRDWQYGYEQVVDYIGKHKDEYDEIIFTRHYGEPHMFTLFYLKFDPVKYQNDPNLVRFETYDWVRVLKFSNFYFPDLGDKGTQFTDIVKANPGKKLLFIGRGEDFPKEIPRLLSVKFLNGENDFDIVEVR